MISFRTFLYIALCAATSLCGSSISNTTSWGDDEIVVHLKTASALKPIYIIPPTEQQSGLSEKYLSFLTGVITFDFNHNGKTDVVAATAEKQKIALTASLEQATARSLWKDAGIQYVIQLSVVNKKLSATTLSVASGVVKSVTDIPLTGAGANDRRRIHQISDVIYNDFFKSEGIATTRILYTVRSKKNTDLSEKWTAEIWECDYDGANARQITRQGNYAITPVYIPAKKGMASNGFLYVSYQVGQPKVFIASLNDGTSQRMSYLRGNQLMPAISSQRDKIAFISDVAGNADLFLQSFDVDVGPLGKPRQIFSAYRSTQGSPCFSPDGTKIAFVSNKDGSPRIYILPISGNSQEIKNSAATLITKVNKENTSPAWSPDGTKIAYSAKVNGSRQIWIYDFSSGEERPLTSGEGHKENPSWAPDSLHIVFNSATPFANDLYLINLNQPIATKISSGTDDQCFPSWEPALHEK